MITHAVTVTLSDDSDNEDKMLRNEPAQTARERTGWTIEATPPLEAGNPCVRKKLEMAPPKAPLKDYLAAKGVQKPATEIRK